MKYLFIGLFMFNFIGPYSKNIAAPDFGMSYMNSQNLTKLTNPSEAENYYNYKTYSSSIIPVKGGTFAGIIVMVMVMGLVMYKSRQYHLRCLEELKLANIDLKRKADKVIALNDMKQKLLTILGHDLRSPFNQIESFSELCETDIKNQDIGEVKEDIEMIKVSTKTGLALLENLLDWLRNEEGLITFEFENVNLKELVDDNFTFYKGISKLKGVGLVNNINPEVVALINIKSINTVLRNLIGNAIKFTSKYDQITVGSTIDNNTIQVYVKDSGRGIKAEVLEQLFETKGCSQVGTANEKGTGLGLFLCKEFIQANGGEIWVESEEGIGSTFYFTIKLSSENIKIQGGAASASG